MSSSSEEEEEEEDLAWASTITAPTSSRKRWSWGIDIKNFTHSCCKKSKLIWNLVVWRVVRPAVVRGGCIIGEHESRLSVQRVTMDLVAWNKKFDD